MNIFKKLKAFLRFREAVRKADEAHLMNRQRYYVIPASSDVLLVVDRKNFRGLRRKNYINRSATVQHLREHSVYHTPDAREMGGVPTEFLKEKFRDYVRWIDAQNEKREA